jgi:hypothetical protein
MIPAKLLQHIKNESNLPKCVIQNFDIEEWGRTGYRNYWRKINDVLKKQFADAFFLLLIIHDGCLSMKNGPCDI